MIIVSLLSDICGLPEATTINSQGYIIVIPSQWSYHNIILP